MRLKPKTDRQGRYVGSALIGLGLLVTIFLGWRGSSSTPPTAVESAAFVSIAALLQIAGGLIISNVGKVDPGLARSSVRRLLGTVQQTNRMRLQVEAGYDSAPPRNRELLGKMSYHLSVIEESTINSIKDWTEVHPEELSPKELEKMLSKPWDLEERNHE